MFDDVLQVNDGDLVAALAADSMKGPSSPQADIYSLGKVLYEISTGRNRVDFPELPTLLKESPERQQMVQFNEVILKACDEDPRRFCGEV